MLSRHKSIQDRLFAEIDEVVGRDGHAAITYHQLLDLKFMEMVIKESMRLYPAVQMIARKIDHDLKLGEKSKEYCRKNFLLGTLSHRSKYIERNENSLCKLWVCVCP